MVRKSVARALLASLVMAISPELAAAKKDKTSAPPAAAKPAAAKPADGKDTGGSANVLGGLSLTSKKEPVQITSEKLDFDYKNRHTVFRGDVEVIQGDVHLNSDTLTVDYDQVGDKQELRQVIADGHVTIIQGEKKATGTHAVFDQSKRTVVLTGDAVLEQGTNQVNGDKIVVYPDDSRMEVIGENRRVKVVLFPGGNATPGAATPGAATAGAATGTPAPGVTPPPATSPPSANIDTDANGADESS